MQLTMFGGHEKFTINKPIRLIELFAGYGSQALALKYLGVDFEHWRICEWAVKSIQAYKDMHFSSDNTDYSKNLTQQEVIDYLTNKGISANYNEPMTRQQIERLGEQKQRQIYNNIQATHNLVNIQQAKASDFNIVDTDKYCYIMTYSYPCCTADSLILTKDGYKEFKDLKVGEYVLTKSNTYQKIAKKFDNGIHRTCYIQAMGFENIHCTLNHKFYVREKYRKGHKGIRCFKEPCFKEAKDITKNDYFGMPVIQDEIPFYRNDLDFWYMIGYYLGDGWLSTRGNDIILACNDKKLKKLIDHLDINKWHYTYHWNSTCYRLRFANKEIYDFIKQNIGTGSLNKKICGDILRLPKNQLKALLEGYIDSDGCRIGKNIQFSSINRNLIYSISSIINKIYHRTTCITKNSVSSKTVIQGRVVNQHDWYMLRFKPMNDKQDKAFYEDGYLWYPFTKLEIAEDENVYNMEVENDHSYIIQGCISKNCQDLSSAGKCAGMAKGSNTRSGMLWEVERILDECDNLPQVLLMENVPEVIGTKNIKHFASWLEKLESLGYKCYWQVLNGKDYGVPQNRERCFMVSILGDYLYEFPEKIKLEHKLNDLLEKNVDEKYYLTDKQLVYAFDCNRVCDNTKRGDLADRKVNPSIAKTISCRGAESQRADITNFVIDDNEKEYTLGEIREEINLKRQLFNKLIEKNALKENDIVMHNYTSRRLNDLKMNKPVVKFNNISPTLDTSCGDCIGVVVNDLQVADGKFQKFKQSEISGTLLTNSNFTGAGVQLVKGSKTNYRIRKLTPLEVFRLMGVKDEDFEKVAKNQSNSSLYHLSGDSIIVQTLCAIFKKML